MTETNLRTREREIGIVKKVKSSMVIQCYLLLGLPLIGFFLFKIYPIFWAAGKAFYYFDNVPSNTQFTGVRNFISLFSDHNYWRAWLTTLKFAVYKLPFEVPLALILAMVLMKTKRLGGFFRTAYFMPHVISIAIVGVIFTNMFNAFGCVNALLQRFGLVGGVIDWFQSPSKTLFVLIIGSLWSGFGINVLYFTAALTNVPEELYEAAEIEGAGAVRKFISITVPMIAPIFQVILLMAINGTLHTGEYVVVMTNGAPAGTSHTVGSYLIATFLPGFSTGLPNVGYGCAMALCTTAIYSLVAVVYLRASKSMQNVY